MRKLMIFTAAAVFASAYAHAQDAAQGEKLYTTAVVSGKLSCGANACHGKLESPQNRIVLGLQAAAIKSATGRVAQMRFLEGKLSDAQFNHLAAYLAGKLGGRATYLPVVAMPVPVLGPASVNFGARELLSASPAQTITVSNAAAASGPLVLGAIGTGSASDFAVAGGTCSSGMSLPVGSSCTVLVTFTPSAVGTRSGQLTVVHNGAAGSSSVPLNGAGTGEAPVIGVSPPALTFSQTIGSTSGALRVLVGNSGSGALQIGALRLSGTHAAEFAIAAGGDCAAGTVLANGQSCSVDLRFTPLAQGTRQASLTIEHNAQGGSTGVALTGIGNASPMPGLMLDANRIDLGAQVVSSTSAPRSLTVINNGQADLSFSAITLRGARAGEFGLGGSTCVAGTPVPAQGRCTIALAVTPADLGAREAMLDIVSNSPFGTASVALAATGVPTPAPVVQLSQAALGFGSVSIGSESPQRTVLLANAGNAPLQIASLATSSAEFRLVHDCPAALAPAARCALRVSYAPSAAAAAEALVITSDAASSPNRVVLSGQGSSTALAVLDWSEGSAPIDLGEAAVGSTGALATRTLVNRGPGSATLSALSVAGADPSAFVVGGGNCAAGTVLAANSSCSVGLRFAPAALGERHAFLQIGSLGASIPPELALSGTGAGFAAAQMPLAASPAALAYPQTITTGGRSPALMLRIVNDSTAETTLASLTTSDGFVVERAEGSDACPGLPWTLAPGASCAVAVVFAPVTGGTSDGRAVITTSAGQTTEVPLSGNANTVMTNVGADSGGGALGAAWLAALALAAGALARRRTPR